jgi:putative sterol carrier protein
VGECDRRLVASQSREFFESLGARRHEPLLATASGTIRFDLMDDGETAHWYVSVNKGDVEVSNREDEADAIVTADEDLFDEALAGRSNAMAAVLRGDIDVTGNLGLLITFQRLFAGPPESARTR